MFCIKHHFFGIKTNNNTWCVLFLHLSLRKKRKPGHFSLYITLHQGPHHSPKIPKQHNKDLAKEQGLGLKAP